MSKIPPKYRLLLLSRYQPFGYNKSRLYIRDDGSSFESTPCYYCGDFSTVDDHIYPLVALKVNLDTNDLPPRHMLRVVPACSWCNAVLHDKVFKNLDARKRYVKQRIRQKFASYINSPEWDEDELDTLGPGLLSHMLKAKVICKKVRARLEW